jgi:hypothetical protein
MAGMPQSVHSDLWHRAPAAFRVRVWQITSRGRGHEGATAAGGGLVWTILILALIERRVVPL